MPKIIINNKEFEIEDGPQKMLDDDYRIIEFKQGNEYKNQTNEEILDILISREDRDKQIEDAASIMTKDYFNDSKHNLSNRFGDLKSSLYRTYREKYEKEFDEENKKIEDKFKEGNKKKNVKEIFAEVDKAFKDEKLLKEYFGVSQNATFKGVYEKINHDLNNLTKEELDKNKDHYKEHNQLRNKAKAVIDYQNKFGSLDVTKAEYTFTKLQSFEKDYVKDPAYKKLENELSQKKEKYYNERKDEIIKNGYISPLQGLKNVVIIRIELVKNILKERENLVKEYNKTSLGSRIARWMPFVPRSWSKAGRIQDELDKLDKAIKDAGFDKKELNNIKKEMKSEKPVVENNNLENKAEEKNNELNFSKDTLKLQDSIQEEIDLSKSKNDLSKPLDNSKTLQKDETVLQ